MPCDMGGCRGKGGGSLAKVLISNSVQKYQTTCRVRGRLARVQRYNPSRERGQRALDRPARAGRSRSVVAQMGNEHRCTAQRVPPDVMWQVAMAVVRKTRADPSHPCPSVFYSNCPYIDVAGKRPDAPVHRHRQASGAACC